MSPRHQRLQGEVVANSGSKVSRSARQNGARGARSRVIGDNMALT